MPCVDDETAVRGSLQGGPFLSNSANAYSYHNCKNNINMNNSVRLRAPKKFLHPGLLFQCQHIVKLLIES